MVGLTMTWPIDVDPFMGYGNIRCECGMTLDMFRMLQRMGCAKCYDVLPIDKIINQYHNATQHIGKTPTTINDDNSIKERIFMLTQAMEVAIRSEHYERAAYLRDQIKLLESMYKEHNKTNEA
ncbi:MAG: UvrB/UvrC motif-containing protein [Candidatus Nitrosocaldus sp.]